MRPDRSTFASTTLSHNNDFEPGFAVHATSYDRPRRRMGGPLDRFNPTGRTGTRQASPRDALANILSAANPENASRLMTVAFPSPGCRCGVIRCGCDSRRVGQASSDVRQRAGSWLDRTRHPIGMARPAGVGPARRASTGSRPRLWDRHPHPPAHGLGLQSRRPRLLIGDDRPRTRQSA